MPSRMLSPGTILPHWATREKAQNFLPAQRSILEVHSRRRGPIVRLLHRGALVVFAALTFSCRRDSGAGAKGGIVAVEVEIPSGADASSVSRCDRDGKKCSPLAKDEGVPSGTLVKITRGARAAFALGPSANLDLGDESAVYLGSSSSLD